MKNNTTIAISREVHQALKDRGRKGETFDDIIVKLLQLTEFV